MGCTEGMHKCGPKEDGLETERVMQVDLASKSYIYSNKKQVHEEQGERHIPDGGAPSGC